MKYKMTEDEYQSCVKYVQEHYVHIPDFLIVDQSNWRNRSILARALMRVEKYEQAIQLFKTVVSTEPEIKFNGEAILTEVEDQVICLTSLALLMQLNDSYDRNEVKVYLETAKYYTEKYAEYFKFFTVTQIQEQIEKALSILEENL